MHKFNPFNKNRLSKKNNNRGQGLVEYALLIALIGLAVIAIVRVMEPAIGDVFSRMVERNAVAPPALAGYTPPPLTPTPSTFILNVMIDGDGVVEQNPNPPYLDGDTVTLGATPGPGYEFDHWELDLGGGNNPETIYMGSDKDVSAVFLPERFTLTVTEIGTGSGSITLDPDQPDYAPNTMVALTANPDTGSNFEEWGGDLGSPNPTVNLEMTDDMNVTAEFRADCFSLTILETPNEWGDVIVNPAPNCNGTDYSYGTVVTLEAHSVLNYYFDRWTGEFTSTINPTSVTMVSDKTVTANFLPLSCFDVNTSVSPVGGGSVSLSPPPNCGSQYLDGTDVTFTAVPAFGNAFSLWGGDLGGTDAIETLTINAVTNVTAIFETPPPQNLARRVNTSSDDAEERTNGSMRLTSSDLQLIYDNQNQIVGIRFVDIQIEPDAAILNAYIQFTADESDSGSTSLVFEGQAADNSPTFDNSSYDLSNRPRTGASINWNSIPSWSTGSTYQTPDLAAIVQEIVNRGGWSEGNAMVFIISGSGQRVAESFNGDSSAAPLLLVEYLNP